MHTQAVQGLYNKLPSVLRYIIQHSHVTEVGYVISQIQAPDSCHFLRDVRYSFCLCAIDVDCVYNVK